MPVLPIPHHCLLSKLKIPNLFILYLCKNNSITLSFYAALLCTSRIAATSSLELPFSYLGVPGVHSVLAAGSIIPVVCQTFADGCCFHAKTGIC